jgi:hypothetical protein
MIRDPFYKEIIKGLNGRLDPEIFERCAQDLLRNKYPTLVPIRGGSDAGMDGAIANGKGTAYPLITTTAKEVIRNLTGSLNSYINKGGKRRMVVAATSRELTPMRRRNLEKRAEELGFTLIQIHSQSDIANRLYRKPEWCVELLNLTGEPPALSVMPATKRPLQGENVIGREDDLTWLRETSGDLLLTGQPGSGKTFLFHFLAKNDEGLFVISEEIIKISQGIRAQQPKILFVDDGHLPKRLDLITKLRQLRSEISADFRIIANCWPGERDEVARELNITSSSIRELFLLTRDQIVEIIKSVGIYGPNQLISELVDQADGRPGLAVTLCYICMKEGVREVILGNALCRDIRTYFEPLVGKKATPILAGFAVGGDCGMTMQAVAEELKVHLTDIQQITAQLSSGGVLDEVGRATLSLRPDALRYALVRDIFFKGATSLPIEGLILRAPHIEEVTITLIRSRFRGASISNDFLLGLVEQCRSDKIWSEFAWLGTEESTWVLDKYPQKLIVIARPALNRAPQKAIPMLLSKAVGDDRELHSNPDQPLRLIDDWIKEAYPGSGEPVRRRKILLETTLDWINDGGDLNIGLKALRSSLSPAFQATETDPGSGMKFSLLSGLISEDEMRSVWSLWKKVIKLIQSANVENWRPVQNIVESWAYPGRIPAKVSDKTRKLMRKFARNILCDVVKEAKENQGILRWAKRVAMRRHFKIKINLNKEFEALYPVEERVDWRKQQKELDRSISKLAKQWCALAPQKVIDKLTIFEQQSKQSGSTWMRGPHIWVKGILKNGLSSDLIDPFLRRSVELKEKGWAGLLEKCLNKESYRPLVVSIVLTTKNVPEKLVDKVLGKLEGLSFQVRRARFHTQISENIMKKLINHKDSFISIAAAIGEWESEPKGEIRKALLPVWRAAIVRCEHEEYELEEIFKADPTVALEWLEARISEDSEALSEHNKTASDAVDVLNNKQKQSILGKMRNNYGCRWLTRKVIGNDISLYKRLLKDKKMKYLHLSPLKDRFQGEWIQAALEAGCNPEEVAHDIRAYSMSWSGKESNMWAGWVESFSRLCEDKDPNIRKVGEIGQRDAKGKREKRSNSWSLVKV